MTVSDRGIGMVNFKIAELSCDCFRVSYLRDKTKCYALQYVTIIGEWEQVGVSLQDPSSPESFKGVQCS